MVMFLHAPVSVKEETEHRGNLNKGFAEISDGLVIGSVGPDSQAKNTE